MRPDIIRPLRRILAAGVSTAVLMPFAANAQTLLAATPDRLALSIAIAVAVGATGFGVFATLAAQRARRRADHLVAEAQDQVGLLRANLDRAEGLISGLPEVSIVWHGSGASPEILGPVGLVLPGETDPERVSRFWHWLETAHAERLDADCGALRRDGVEFERIVTGRDGRALRLAGRRRGTSSLLRISEARDATPQPDPKRDNSAGIVALLSKLDLPGWCGPADDPTRFANPALKTLARQADGSLTPAQLVERLENGETMDAGSAGTYRARTVDLGGHSVGLALPLSRPEPARPDPMVDLVRSAFAGVTLPLAVFDARQRLVLYTRAYADLWGLDGEWLDTRPREQAVLDRLRTEDRLPREADYRKWRDNHLKSYGLNAPRTSFWALPNGEMLNVTAASAGPDGGVIYLFDNVSDRIGLETSLNRLVAVQRETIDALSEAVAVFGTDGRLRLHNSQFSQVWKVPLNVLQTLPHIDELAGSVAEALPQDGSRIWSDLKRPVFAHGAEAGDTGGRIERSDGRLIDFATARLPDGQTLMRFADVTRSAQFEKVLKERNEALEAADTLKDAFVRNVSYELRSPLTTIIGFADMLSGEVGGGLTGQQQQYIDYIRTSSQALMLIIDNILTLANVDAGIVTIAPVRVAVKEMIEKARAGLVATLQSDGGMEPATLRIDLPDPMPELDADPTRLVQILFNLLANAVRFSEPGTPVTLRVETRPDRVLFIVEDEGVGIPDQYVSSVFDRFEGRASEGRQRGAGLGLTIVKTFVHLHGGTVRIEKREPKGTRVTVNLPQHQKAYGTG